jgi:hypothetical protein
VLEAAGGGTAAGGVQLVVVGWMRIVRPPVAVVQR